ncbi:YifB family Mg chelatase-like AAA ATPase [Candidatus Peregrinibacteria bacterium]|nr:YifB family Mg chelatase-like AAA ATPase [Candidatus Peregrinibacteria bacterium]
MPVTLYSCSLQGLSGVLTEVEVDILSGIPAFTIVGLTDTSIQEAKERIISAIKNSGFEFPRMKKTINLAPADTRKHGPLFDLPIALGLLLASGQIPFRDDFRESIFAGELALDGSLRRIHGALLLADFAKKHGYKRIFLPEANALEASLVSEIDIYPLQSLRTFENFFSGRTLIQPLRTSELDFEKWASRHDRGASNHKENSFDMSQIQGLTHAKRALEIAAAGSHNVLFTGPPGSGKTLLARSFSTILPKLNLQEALEVTKMYSLMGRLDPSKPLITTPPFRSVHHKASAFSILGGGAFPRPGEISLAHKGVLFLDEIAEFSLSVLETLRQPLEDHSITIGRASATITYPAHFTLIAAMNPCPCGYLHDAHHSCACSSSQVLNYQKKLSGPFLDRMDIFLDIPRTKVEILASDSGGEISKSIRERVQKARDIQTRRFQTHHSRADYCAENNDRGTQNLPDENLINHSITSNSEMSLPLLRKHCKLDISSQNILKQALNTFHLSNRSYYRILKVARTIADLQGEENISEANVAEALQYRKR